MTTTAPQNGREELKAEILAIVDRFGRPPDGEDSDTFTHAAAIAALVDRERKKAVSDYKDAVFSRLCSENAPHRGQTHRILATVLETLYPSKP